MVVQLSIVHDKCMKRKNKLHLLINNIGYFGPIVDLIIRGTINCMLSRHFAEDTKNVCGTNTLGRLYKFLLDNFRGKEIVDAIKSWMRDSRCTADYECAYRCKRNELINAQITFLTLNPGNLVSDMNPIQLSLKLLVLIILGLQFTKQVL